MQFPTDLPALLKPILKDVMLRLGQPITPEYSEPFHPQGVWFIDLVWGDNRVVYQYSPRFGHGVSLNDIAFSGAPTERVPEQDVAGRIVELLKKETTT